MLNQTVNTTSRIICNQCQFPINTCICKAITPQACRHRIIILQHPKEAKHSKNSAKLVKLSIEECQIYVGKRPPDFAMLISELIVLNQQQGNILVIYPSSAAQLLEQFKLKTQANFLHKSTTDKAILIFIDATWRKAYKMWHQNNWLHQFPTFTFAHPPSSQYHIRTTRQPNSLSTLEAIAYSLYCLDGTDTTALYKTFAALNANFLHYQPQNH